MFRPLKPYQIVVDVVLAGLFALIVAPVELSLAVTADTNALGTALITVLFAGALAVRRLSPGLSLGIAWVGAIVQMGFGRNPGPVDLAIFAVLFATAAYGSRLVFWLGFSSAIVGAGVITLYLFAGPVVVTGLDWSTITTAAAVLIAALFALLLAWTVGALVRTAIRARENRAAQQRAEQVTVAEQERVRIARDMHDVVAHSLTVVIAQADGARYASAADPAAVPAALETISATARSALADVRLLLTQLRHSQGDGPQPTLADLEGLYAQVRAAGVDLRVDVDPAPPGGPPAAAQLAVYRILQEALTNALRHGDGGAVEVRLAWLADRVELSVRNAMGTDAAPGAGHGVIGMRERAQLAGGSLTAEAADGVFVVRSVIPIGATA
ncbi:sensor histidine kinase [Microbacterium sp. SS28]|uniref:sensor histidine kinase n=1 Tax=Microbacterium sp. SS28 TaxID=2919948 RepID=UPI001FA985EF|nr:histidine kinase [Microbacterium sp. SS28]